MTNAAFAGMLCRRLVGKWTQCKALEACEVDTPEATKPSWQVKPDILAWLARSDEAGNLAVRVPPHYHRLNHAIWKVASGGVSTTAV